MFPIVIFSHFFFLCTWGIIYAQKNVEIPGVILYYVHHLEDNEIIAEKPWDRSRQKNVMSTG